MLPGTDEPIDNIEEAEKIAKEIKFPVIKAVSAVADAVCVSLKRLRILKRCTSLQPQRHYSFSRGETFIEKYLKTLAISEIQIVADNTVMSSIWGIVTVRSSVVTKK